MTYLAPATVSAGNGGALSRGGSLVDDGPGRRRRGRIDLGRGLIDAVRMGRERVLTLHVRLDACHIGVLALRLRLGMRRREVLERQLGVMDLARVSNPPAQASNRCGYFVVITHRIVGLGQRGWWLRGRPRVRRLRRPLAVRVVGHWKRPRRGGRRRGRGGEEMTGPGGRETACLSI